MFRVMVLNICYGVIRMIDWGKRKKEKKSKVVTLRGFLEGWKFYL